MAINRQVAKGFVGNMKVIAEGEPGEFVSFSVCTSEYAGKDKHGENVYNEQWFNVLAFAGNAKRIKASKMATGDFVEVEGPHRSKKTEKDGVKYENWSIILDEFEILRRKEEAA